MVTGTSVLGVKFNGGVIIAADTLGSYGSLARFRNLSRLLKVNDTTMLGASGDYADFQYLKQIIDQMVIDEELLGDGHSYSPKAIHSWLTRVMYNRRSKINPLWNTVVIGGYYNGESFLGYVDMLGVAYEAPTLATGYGAYLAQPLMREVLEKKPSLTKEEARDLIERCMKILYYRDARSFNRVSALLLACLPRRAAIPVVHLRQISQRPVFTPGHLIIFSHSVSDLRKPPNTS
uniref:Proteasome subunit beta n=1 Tax=Dromaius novaehollandiae TaxID=8790 RepID=A0A8C4J0Q7_DRONO